MRIKLKSNKRPRVLFCLANLSTSLRPKESHRVYLPATGAFLSYFLPRRLKRELYRAGEDKKRCTGRSIKCSNAVQAKSYGNSQRGVEVHLLVSAPQVIVKPAQHCGIVAHNVRTILFHLALALSQRYSMIFPQGLARAKATRDRLLNHLQLINVKVTIFLEQIMLEVGRGGTF